MNLIPEHKPKPTLEEMEERAKKEHMVKVYRDGHVTFYEPGQKFRDRGGRVYEVQKDGSMRRVKN